MRRFLASVALVCLFCLAPTAHAAVFSDSQISSLLGLLTAFGVPQNTINTVHSIIGSNSSGGSTFDPFAPGARQRITYVSHHSRSSTPAPAEYRANAVHFDGATNLTKLDNSINYTDGFTYSAWINLTDQPSQDLYANLFSTLNGLPLPDNGEGTSISIPFNFSSDLGVGFETAESPSPTGGAFGGNSVDGLVSVGSWHHIFVSADSNHVVGSRIVNIYLDGVSVLDPENNYDNPVGPSGGDFVTMENGPVVNIGGVLASQFGFDPYAMASLSMADVEVWLDRYIAPGQIDKFIRNGKPIDPAIAAAQIGPPTYSFSGDVAAWLAQAASQGFTVEGQTLTNADTSPSD